MERPALEAGGHAIEVRIYAENPDAGFLPSPGVITYLRAPSGPGVRDDSGAYPGWSVPTAYDPLVSKLIAWAPDRPGAIARTIRALDEYDLRGITTTIGFCRRLVASDAFASGDFDTTTVDRLLQGRDPEAQDDGDADTAVVAAAMWVMRQAASGPGRRTPNASASVQRESVWGQRARTDGLR
jgi:acetyl-CoA carboxylase biotin carboxylase subunit